MACLSHACRPQAGSSRPLAARHGLGNPCHYPMGPKTAESSRWRRRGGMLNSPPQVCGDAMPVVTVQNEALQFEVESNSNLLQALRKNGVSPYGIISQFMPFLFRGADDVLVIDGKRNLSEPTEKEKR